MEAQRGVEIYLYSFFTLGARWEWVVNVTPRPLDARWRNPVPVVPVDPTTGLDGCGKPRSTIGSRSLDRPSRRETVYLKTHTKHKMEIILMLELVVIVGNKCYSRSWSGLLGLRQRTRGYTGRFTMFFVITNIYNKKTKGPTLMEFFTAIGKEKKSFFFFTTRDVRCVHHGCTRHTCW